MENKKSYKKIMKLRINCNTCQKFMNTNHKYGTPAGNITTTISFQHISPDIYGPIETVRFEEGKGKIYLCIITDRCTRRSEVYIMKDLKPESAIKALSKWLNPPPLTKACLSNQGSQYTSNLFQAFLQIIIGLDKDKA